MARRDRHRVREHRQLAIRRLTDSLADDELDIEDALTKVQKVRADVVAALLEALEDEQPVVRKNAADLLREAQWRNALGPKGWAEAVRPGLLRVFANEGEAEHVRVAAGEALPGISWATREEVDTLIGLLESAAPAIRYTALLALGSSCPVPARVADAIAPLLEDVHLLVRVQAAEALDFSFQYADQVIAAMTPLWRTPGSCHREQAAMCIGRMMDHARGMALEFADAAGDPQEQTSIRAAALYALQYIARRAPESVIDAIPTLLTCLDNPDLRQSAVGVFIELKEHGAPAMPIVAAWLDGDDWQLRDLAVRFLMSEFSNADVAVPGLCGMVVNRSLDARFERCDAATALGVCGRKSAEARETLVAVAVDESEDSNVRAAALAALADSPVALPQLWPTVERCCNDSSQPAALRAAALRVSPAAGQPMEVVAPMVIRALNDESFGVRAAASAALPKLGRYAEPAVAVLCAMLKRPRDYGLAADALGSLGSLAASAIASLREFATDSDAEIGQAASEAIAKISERSEYGGR
ncbi:MAG: hypothetical protein H6816_03605 [Phycisphaerales bacterium]|nr:hypothetical protein [Phycisphaerales bacterium]